MTPQDRQNVLDSALDLCSRQAPRDISLEQLARDAGVSALEIVRTFLSKENILKAVLERELEMMAAAAHDPALRMPGETLRDELVTLSRIILDEYRRRLPMLGRLLSESMADPAVGAVFYRTFIMQGRQLFTEFLNSRARLGELRENLDVEAAAAMFLSSLTGALLMVELFGGKQVEALDDARYVSQAADIFLQGVGRK